VNHRHVELLNGLPQSSGKSEDLGNCSPDFTTGLRWVAVINVFHSLPHGAGNKVERCITEQT
jgi:hypothetical protein